MRVGELNMASALPEPLISINPSVTFVQGLTHGLVSPTDPQPKDYLLYYGFSTFAMELNELTPDMKPLLPPTDSRLRPDQRCEVCEIQHINIKTVFRVNWVSLFFSIFCVLAGCWRKGRWMNLTKRKMISRSISGSGERN